MRSSLLLLGITLVLGAGVVSACDGGSASAPFSAVPSSLAVPTRPDAGAPPSDAAADAAPPTDAHVDVEAPDASDAGEELDAAPDV